MIVRQPEILIPISSLDNNILNKIERYARVCYKSEKNSNTIQDNSLLKKIIAKGHESVLEHEKATILLIVDRGVSHEIVRHRIASYSQESTRYCNYSLGKFGGEITVIQPFFLSDGMKSFQIWKDACIYAEKQYMKLIELGLAPQEARSVLPNSLKTEIVVTYNLREWRHFFRLRTSSAAHPQMRQVAIPLLLKFKEYFPVIFEDIDYDKDFSIKHYAAIILTDDFFHNKASTSD